MSVFQGTEFDDHEQVVFVNDRNSGLTAIIAIHSTTLGPSIGGLRIWPYESEAAAVKDVLRLSKGMTYKAAITGVPFGGGKTVVILASGQKKTPALLQAMGRAIEQLGGRYITGEDVGSTADDMVEISKSTEKVMGLPIHHGGSGDPSPSTALGCFVGVQACVKHRLRRDDLSGVRVAVQGLGNVGWNLCRQLAEANAKLVVTDVRPERIAHCVEELNAASVAVGSVYDVEADVFAPCALGAVINDETLPRLKVPIVAGGANNQLARPEHGPMLRQRGILYAPDYAINGGGMIQLAAERVAFNEGAAYDPDLVERDVRRIYGTLMEIFQRADREQLATSIVADRIAEDRIQGAKEVGRR